MAFTMDTTLGTLLDNPQAKAVLEQYVPGISTHPMVAMAIGMTLNMLLSMPQAAQLGLTKDKAEMILAEVNKQKPQPDRLREKSAAEKPHSFLYLCIANFIERLCLLLEMVE
jgi:hypothetical protein